MAVGLLLATTGCKRAKATRAESKDEATSESKSTEPGVFEDHLVLWSTAVFTGPNTSWGADTWRGSAAYLQEVNSKGGVHGRRIDVVSVDDGYETPRAMTNLKQAIERNDFFVAYDFVGSNVMIETVAELDKHRAKNIFQFASIASTTVFRKGPNADRAFAVRAPISLEMKQAVDAFIASGKKKIAVFHQDDAYGKSGYDGVVAALADHGLKPVAETKHAVFAKFDESVKAQVDEMKAAGAEVVFDIGNYQAAAALVRDARDQKWAVPIVNNASINDAFIRMILAHEHKTGTKAVYNLVGVKVVPSPDEKSYPLIQEYRELIDRRNPKPPSELTDPNFRQNTYAFQQVEGFVNAKIMVEILNRMGPNPVRAKFKDAAESIKNWDVGLGEAKVTFGPDDHTALDKVWLYYVNKEGDWVPLTDLKAALTPTETPPPTKPAAPTAKK
jgi:ABC-type branched-subunit amino acid transport system substrate-binding protein